MYEAVSPPAREELADVARVPVREHDHRVRAEALAQLLARLQARGPDGLDHLRRASATEDTDLPRLLVSVSDPRGRLVSGTSGDIALTQTHRAPLAPLPAGLLLVLDVLLDLVLGLRGLLDLPVQRGHELVLLHARPVLVIAEVLELLLQLTSRGQGAAAEWTFLESSSPYVS